MLPGQPPVPTIPAVTDNNSIKILQAFQLKILARYLLGVPANHSCQVPK